MLLMIFIFALATKCWLTTTALSPEDYKVELVQVIFRHGDRVPGKKELDLISMKIPYNESIYTPFGHGQMTNIGKKRVYEVGQALRDRYGNFLSTTYDSSEVYAYSTGYDRTRMSLQLVLAGLYPTFEVPFWPEDVSWTPFPSHHNESKFDFFLTPEACPKYLQLRSEVLHSDEIKNRILKYRGTIYLLLENVGQQMINPVLIFLYYHMIECHKSMGWPLPLWLTESNYEELKEIAAIYYEALLLTNEMKKLAVGAMLKKFIENIDNQEKGGDKRKIYLYGAHDLNVNGFLKSHGFKYPKLLEFGATVIMEKLRGPDNGIYIRLFVWSGANKKMTLRLSDCKILCPLSKYLEIINPVLPDGSETECAVHN